MYVCIFPMKRLRKRLINIKKYTRKNTKFLCICMYVCIIALVVYMRKYAKNTYALKLNVFNN